MVKEIIWTEDGLASFEAIITYLLLHFTEKEVERFVTQAYQKIQFITDNPTVYPLTKKKKNIRSTSIHKKTRIFYRYKAKESKVELLLFWDVRRSSASMNKLL